MCLVAKGRAPHGTDSALNSDPDPHQNQYSVSHHLLLSLTRIIALIRRTRSPSCSAQRVHSSKAQKIVLTQGLCWEQGHLSTSFRWCFVCLFACLFKPLLPRQSKIMTSVTKLQCQTLKLTQMVCVCACTRACVQCVCAYVCACVHVCSLECSCV